MATSDRMDTPSGPRARQALNGVPSGPGAEFPLCRTAVSMSFLRMRQDADKTLLVMVVASLVRVGGP